MIFQNAIDDSPCAIESRDSEKAVKGSAEIAKSQRMVDPKCLSGDNAKNIKQDCEQNGNAEDARQGEQQ